MTFQLNLPSIIVTLINVGVFVLIFYLVFLGIKALRKYLNK